MVSKQSSVFEALSFISHFQSADAQTYRIRKFEFVQQESLSETLRKMLLTTSEFGIENSKSQQYFSQPES